MTTDWLLWRDLHKSLVQHRNCALFLSGKITSCLWLVDCGLYSLSMQRVSTVSCMTKRYIKVCQGTIFVLRYNMCEMLGKTSRFQDTPSYGRDLGHASVVEGNRGSRLAGTGTGRWRTAVRVRTADWAPPARILQILHSAPHSCICVSCVDLRTNSDYFPIQH